VWKESFDRQTYFVDECGLAFRLPRTRTKSGKKEQQKISPPTNATNVAITRISLLRCEACYSEREYSLVSGDVSRCDICGEVFPAQQLHSLRSERIEYPFNRVRDCGTSRLELLGRKLEFTRINREHIFGDEFSADFQEAENRLGDHMALELGNLKEDYFFLSNFVTFRYGALEDSRFILNLYFFYHAYRAFDAAGDTWSQHEILRLGAKLIDYVRQSFGIPADDSESDGWGVACGVSAALIVVAFTRLSEVHGTLDDADEVSVDDLRYLSGIVFDLALNQLLGPDDFHVVLRLCGCVATVWSAYSGWISDDIASWAATVANGKVRGGSFQSASPSESDAKTIRPFIPPADEFDPQEVLALIIQMLVGHFERRQVQTQVYEHIVHLRSVLYVPSFKQHLLGGRFGTTFSEEEIAKGVVARLAWLRKELDKKASSWIAKRRSNWAVQVAKLFLGSHAAYGLDELVFQAHVLLQAACIFVLRDDAHVTSPSRLAGLLEHAADVFNAASVHFADIGWTFEALSLMEFYRGWITMAPEFDSRRSDRARARFGKGPPLYQMSSRVRAEMISQLRGVPVAVARMSLGIGPESGGLLDAFRAELSGQTRDGEERSELQTFAEDFEDMRLLDALERRMTEEGGRTLAISLTWTSSAYDPTQMRAFAALCMAGGGSKLKTEKHTWHFPREVLRQLWTPQRIRPGVFRNRHLTSMASEAYIHLIEPFLFKLPRRDFSDVAICCPGVVAVLPLESIFEKAGLTQAAVTAVPTLKRIGSTKVGKSLKGARIKVMTFSGKSLTAIEEEVGHIAALDSVAVDTVDCSGMTSQAICSVFEADADIFHCCAHGRYVADDPDESSLLFTDEFTGGLGTVNAEAIARNVRFSKGALVVLSACSTALVPNDRINSWLGLAGAFLRAGASAVVAARWPVSDRAASAFFKEFYARMSMVADAKTAVRGAKDALRSGGARLEEWDCFACLGAY